MAAIELVVFAREPNDRIAFLREACAQTQVERVKRLFVIELNAIGDNPEANRYLLEATENGTFQGAVCALVVISDSDLYTKTYARKFIFLSNRYGCEWIGHPLVECTRDDLNFRTWSKHQPGSLEAIAYAQMAHLVGRLSQYAPLQKEQFNLLALHASHRALSNTLTLWSQVEARLNTSPWEGDRAVGADNGLSIDVLNIGEGAVADCRGCSFETCRYYGMAKDCFYGGIVVDALYPKLEAADVVVWICPNYNDAVSAKLMAVINRLTALYRATDFSEKYLMAVIVSGNSGSDAVAEQLIGALTVNKGLRLPPYFALMAVANDPGEVLGIPGIETKIERYAGRIRALSRGF